MLIDLLKSLSETEILRFEEFLSSPYFNKAVYLKNYFLKLKDLHPHFQNFEDEKIAIFKSLYNKEYNDTTVRKLNSELLKLAEEFISINLFRSKSILKNSLLLEELDKRKNDKLFQKRLSETYSLVENFSLKNEKYFKEMGVLNDAEILFHSMRDRRKGFSKYYTSIENLDKAYIIQKLKKIIILITEDRHFAKILKDRKEIESFIKLIQKNPYFEFPVIQILTNVIMINWEANEKYFHALKQLLSRYKNEISIDELEWAYFAMMNFIVFQVNKGKKEFAKEELELYRNIISDNLLLYNDTLESVLFKNIISCAVDVGDLKFAEDFKDEYSRYILTDDKKDIVEYCNANINYAKKQYSTALETLSKINFTDVNQKFSLRNLTLKIYYESEMYEQAILTIESYKQNLKREKTLPEGIKKLYSSFINLYQKILKLKLTPGKYEAQALLKTILKTETIAKNWLLEQVSYLI
ncbi:MAG: hypothetical protein JST55_16880 [Bacteroidetes bacterium]|nr:hypothetical protein [Bacteroidota bacterium]